MYFDVNLNSRRYRFADCNMAGNCKMACGTAPTLTTTASARDKVALDWDGTQYDGQCAKDFK